MLSVRVCLVCVMRRRAEPRIAGLWLGVPRSRSQCKKSPAEARLEGALCKGGYQRISRQASY
jgi:hypothetical protein